MKFCRSCGKELNDNAKFCGGCGAATSVKEAAPAPVMRGASAPVNYSTVPLLTNNNVPAAVKKCAASPLFLVCIILFTITTLLSLVSSFDSMSSALYLSSFDISYSSDTASVMAIFAAIPSILVVLGMWITYFSAIGNNSKISTAGLSIIKVIMVISLVLICVGAGLMTIGLAIIAIALESGELRREIDWDDILPRGSSADVEAVLAIATIIGFMIVVAVVVLAIIYYAKVIGTINVVKSTVETGRITGEASGFVAVMSIIFGAISISSALVLIADEEALAGFSSLLSALTSILFGALLFSYNKRISQFKTQL